ncbi:ankyrin [Paramuricea clavata]|uniref:Ankyrin, partial n=1 Tax=Paramuricea clavata TaxID=317549 RepID=A0A7D9IHE3_PARCT|nr:ankyrin [Paramuricea clavata]
MENGNHSLTQILLNARVNPNFRERCGATPLTLAVLKGDEKMVKLLIDNFSICEDNYFSSVPGPRQIASKLGFENIVTIIDDFLANENQTDLEVWEVTSHSPNEPLVVLNDETAVETNKLGYYSRNITNCKTIIVGDQGTKKMIRSVKNKSQSTYSWAADVPGDMHTRDLCF